MATRLDEAAARVYVKARMKATGQIPLSVALGGEAGIDIEVRRFLEAQHRGLPYRPGQDVEAQQAGHWEEAAEQLVYDDKRAWKEGHAPRPIIPWENDFKEQLAPGVRQIFNERNGE